MISTGKSKLQKRRTVVLFIIILIVIIAGGSGLTDGSKLRSLSSDVEKLTAKLEAIGGAGVQPINLCEKFETKLGEGRRSCREGVSVSVGVEGEEQANQQLDIIGAAVGDGGLFTPTPGLPSVVRNQLWTTGTGGYTHQTGKTCIAGYTYDDGARELSVRFTCDTTPIYTRVTGL